MKRLIFAFALWLGALGAAFGQSSVFVPATTTTTPITGTVATATRIIPGISGKSIYVTALNLVPVATSVVTLTAGTGTACGTGTVSLTGAMTFAAGQTVSLGNGYGTVLVVPQSTDLCITISTAASPGSIAYSLF